MNFKKKNVFLIAALAVSIVFCAGTASAGQYYIRKNTEKNTETGQTEPKTAVPKPEAPKTAACTKKEAETLKGFQNTINTMYDKNAGQKAAAARARIEKFYSDPNNIPYLSDLYTRCGHTL